jgi:hypothetical protein
MAPVESVEQSSTTMMAEGGTVCSIRERTVSAIVAASLKAGTMTVSPGRGPAT